jgi:hypothetical protein
VGEGGAGGRARRGEGAGGQGAQWCGPPPRSSIAGAPPPDRQGRERSQERMEKGQGGWDRRRGGERAPATSGVGLGGKDEWNGLEWVSRRVRMSGRASMTTCAWRACRASRCCCSSALCARSWSLCSRSALTSDYGKARRERERATQPVFVLEGTGCPLPVMHLALEVENPLCVRTWSETRIQTKT